MNQFKLKKKIFGLISDLLLTFKRKIIERVTDFLIDHWVKAIISIYHIVISFL